jgi:hypothetical protein
MSELPPPVAEETGGQQELIDEVHRLRKALQSMVTTLDSASDDSLRAATRICRGMALTALSSPVPAAARRPTTAGGSIPRPTSGEVRPPKDDTQPGTPAFQEARPVSEGDRPVMIPPAKEPSKKITEPTLAPFTDPTPRPGSKG